MIVEEGRVCIKIAGREAGKKCVIMDVIDKNFVIVFGDGVKKRKCSIRHLDFCDEKIEIQNESDEEIINKLGKNGNEQPKEHTKAGSTKKRAHNKK